MNNIIIMLKHIELQGKQMLDALCALTIWYNKRAFLVM